MEREKLKKEKETKLETIKSFFYIQTVHATSLIVVNKRQPVNQRYESFSIPFFHSSPLKFFKTQESFPFCSTKNHDTTHPTVDDVLLTNPFPLTSIRGCIILWPCIDLRVCWISSAGTPVTQGKWLTTRQLKESGIEKDCERHGNRPLDSTPFSKILSMVYLSSYYASAAHDNRKEITGEGFSSATDCLVCSPSNSITWVLSRSGVCVCVWV